MRIVHVDENGSPDQSLGLVLRKVLGLQLRIWTIVAFIVMVVFAILMGLRIVPLPC